MRAGLPCRLLAIALPMGLSACPAFLSDNFQIVSDATPAIDTGIENLPDATIDGVSSDAGAMHDRADDEGSREGSTSDVVTNGTIEASTDAPGDAATDALIDAAAEAPVDVVVGPDVAFDASPDAPNCPAGSCAEPPSCQVSAPGTTNCGASGESCCTSLTVAGGTYYRTYSNSGSGPTGQADQATVSGFRLDKYLVTVGRYRRFVAAWSGGAGYTPPTGSGKHTHLNGGQGLANSGSIGTYETGWLTTDNSNIAPTSANLACAAGYQTWTNSAGNQETLPINCVNWWEAFAFCDWDGGFLPSESEAEYAEAGGTQQREYPWGSTDPGVTNQYAIYGCYYPSGLGSCTDLANIAPVGTATLGAGLWGQLDLAGEIREWTMDWNATYVNPCTDCAYLTSTSYRMFRGGYFFVSAPYLTPADRFSDTPALRNSIVGVRCARTL